MTRYRLCRWLPFAVFGLVAVLSLEACGRESEALLADPDKMTPLADAGPEAPRVTLYMTSWCGYCRKARRLLDSLDVPYEAKDIEASREAAREYRAKAGNYDGIPLLDIDGRIVKGYQAELIHELVTRLKRQG